MSAERGWIVPPRPNPHSVEAWAERHRRDGHHPYPAPTAENPERWECKCDPDAAWTAVWRILTLEQTERKFRHLGAAAEARREGRARPWDDPAWQERIRQATQRVAEHERSQGTQ
jgi:hypothetical protein